MASIKQSRGIEPTTKRAADEAPQPQQRAKKPKTTISVAGLFAKKPRAEHEHVASTDGITRKQLTAEEILIAKAKRHPAYLDVKRTWRVSTRCAYSADPKDRSDCCLRTWRSRIHR